MSIPSEASAISYESVAEHIAKRKPPPVTYSLIFLATASLACETFSKPNLFASFSNDFFCSLYHDAFLNEA